jgi:hypothetical protein
MLGKGYLCAVVTQDAANWLTPCAMESEKAGLFDKGQMGQSLSAMANRGELSNWPTPECKNHVGYQVDSQGVKWPRLASAVTQHGQAAPANPNTYGSPQGLWATPQAHDAQGPKTPEQIAAMRAKGHGVKNLNEQATWATPQLQDGHNINQDSTTHKTIPAQLTKMNRAGKLNPRWVETLMGLPVGWVMPSCASPVTIEQTNFDSSATESCLQQPRELFAF